MCGRFAFYSPSEAVAALFNVSASTAVQPRYNIAPTQFVAAIRRDAEQKNELAMLRWGLVPFWAKDPSIGNRMINARAETVAEKPAYRTPFQRRRCLVVASGFYEWHGTSAGKVPIYFSHQAGQPLAFAGLWDRWQDPQGATLDSCSIITAAALGVTKPYHHRMPVILDASQYRGWMARETDVATLATWLEKLPAPPLQCWSVSTRVNDPGNDDPELLEPTVG
jgi:putative SOS response-associated peptidase YedK